MAMTQAEKDYEYFTCWRGINKNAYNL
jgi:hypothetical protein